EIVEDAAELRPRLEAELDQVVTVDGEGAKPVRAGAVLLDHPAEACECVDLVPGRRLAGAPPLAEQVRVLVVNQVEGELVAVPAEKASRAKGVALTRLEH